MTIWRRGTFTIDTDPLRLDRDLIHSVLTTSYWAAGIPRDVVERSIAGSIPFGVYDGARQVGFARVISDEATFAWLCDVFIVEEYRGQGIGVWLVECIREHPSLQGLRRWLLATRDAHDLYRKVGFGPLGRPESYMEIRDPDVYRRLGHAPPDD